MADQDTPKQHASRFARVRYEPTPGAWHPVSTEILGSVNDRLNVPEITKAALVALAALCERVIAEYRAFGARTQWIRSAASPLELDREAMRRKLGPRGPWDGEPAREAGEIALLLLPAAQQHLAGIAGLLRECEVIFPVAPVARALLEHLGRVAWVLDPRINPRERAARATLIRVDDLTVAKKLAKSLGQTRRRSRLGQRLHHLRKVEIPARFYPSEIVAGDSGKLVIAGQEMPGLRESVDDLDDLYDTRWNAGGMYDFLSSATHPNVPFVWQMIDKASWPPKELPGADDQLGAQAEFNFTLSDMTYPTRLVRNVLVTFVDVVDLAAQYHGINWAERDALLSGIDVGTTLGDEPD